MKTSRTVLVSLAVLALGGCGTHSSGSPTTSATPSSGQVRYTATGTVLQDKQHGPQLCGAVATSYPPQCGGVDIVGWDWSKVQSEQRNGVRWGEYQLVGTWDGTRLTLTEPPRPPVEAPIMPPPASDRFATPCPAPQGGWRPVDTSKATDQAQEQAIQRAQSLPEFAGAWVDQSYLDALPPGTHSTAANDPSKLVLNLRFTGDLAGREAWIREVWGGALCVSGAERSEAELRRISEGLHDDLKAVPGVQVITTSVDTVANRAQMEVFVATPELRRWLDEKYGPGIVEVEGFLKPIA